MCSQYDKSKTHTDTAADAPFPFPLLPFDPALSNMEDDQSQSQHDFIQNISLSISSADDQGPKTHSNLCP